MSAAPTVPRLVWMLLGASGLGWAMRLMVYPFFTIYLAHTTALSPAAVGVIVGLGAVGQLVCGPLAGHWSDRVGRRSLILLGLGAETCVLLGLGLVHRPWGFAALSLCMGASGALQLPALRALLTDLTPPSLRTRVFGYEYWGMNLGAAVGPLVGAAIGAGQTAVPFLIAACAPAALVLVFWRVVPRGRTAAQEGQGARTLKDAAAAVAHDRTLLAALAGMVCVGLAYSQIDSNLARHISTVVPGGTAVYGIMMSAMATTVIVLQPLATRLAERWRPHRGLVVGPLIYAASSLALLAAGRTAGLWIGIMVVFTIGEVLIAPAQQGVVAELAPEHLRGSYFAAQGLSRSLAFMVGPGLGGALLGGPGAAALFLAMAAAQIAGALFSADALRRLTLRSSSAAIAPTR